MNKNAFYRLLAICFLLLSSACSAAPASPTATTLPELAASATPALQTATSSPSATPQPAATFPGAPLAQVTPVSTPGSGWKTFSTAGVTFLVPAGWQELSAGVLEGPDGFAHLSSLPFDGTAPAAVCVSEANRDKPTRFGRYPEIRDLYQDGRQTGCLILPSPDQPAARRTEALLLLWPPLAGQAGERLVLNADRAHIEAVAASLKINEPGAAAPSKCDFSVQGQPPRTYQAGGLTITEYAAATAGPGGVGSAGYCDPLADPPAFNTLASTGEAAARTASIVEEQFNSRRLARLNQKLAVFGLHVRVVERRFVIEQNGNKLHANLSWIGPLTIKTGENSAPDFRLPVVDGYDAGNFILSPSGLQRQEGWDILLYDRVFPIFAGDDLVSLAYDYQVYPRQVNNPALLNIFNDGQLIDTWSLSGSTLDGGPVRGLWAWQEHWILELPGIVLEDGENLNQRLGYDEMFTWRLIGERPFYFFRKDGQVQISYDSQVLEPVYDEVLYQPLGGTAILLEMKTFENGLYFYARRGDTWYYVTIQS